MKLILKGGEIDIADAQVSLEWANLRFSGGIRDAFTTDITIPSNTNNLNVLNASGLLDSPNQKFGDYITPACVTIHDVPMDVLVQVTSVKEDAISLTLYEQTIPSEFFDMKIGDYFTDTANTIWVWSVNSDQDQPTYFRRYNYGFGFNDHYAQRHPVMKLNDIITSINNQSDYNFQLVDDDLYLMATKKTVCPQNTRQVIHCWNDQASSTEVQFTLSGGQHVVNDLEGIDYSTKLMDSDVTVITFNRACTMNGYLYYSFRSKAVAGTPNARIVNIRKNGNLLMQQAVCQANGTRCGLGVMSLNQITFAAGDTLEIWGQINEYNKYWQVILDVEYSNYTVDDEDYGEELMYAPNHPTLYYFPNTDIDDREAMYFDANFYSKSISSSTTVSLYLPYRHYSYFGFWCNFPDLTVKELVYAMCWYQGKKVRTVNTTVSYIDANEKKKLDLGVVTDKKPITDKLGRKSLIGYKDEPNPTTLTFDNYFLDKEKDIYKSVFQYVDTAALGLAKLNQYEYEMDDEDDDVTITFNDIDAPVLLRLGRDERGITALLPPNQFCDLNIGELSTVMAVTIETYDEVKDLDYVYLDGRKYFVIDGTYDVQTHLSALNCLLVATSVPKTSNMIIVPAIISIVPNASVTDTTITYRIASNTQLGTAKMLIYKLNSGFPTVTFDEVSCDKNSAKIQINVSEDAQQTFVKEITLTSASGSVTTGSLQDGEYMLQIQASATRNTSTKFEKNKYYFTINSNS